MHPTILREFERICSCHNITGSVLEVGAVPSPKSLLCLKALKGAQEKIGLNLSGPAQFADFTILKGNANCMDRFEDDRFDVVLCNAVLEHDIFFFKSLTEMKRVAKAGGLIVIGTPGYRYYPAERIKSVLKNIPLLRRLRHHAYLNMFFTATLTFQVHDAPGDYYRFSPQIYRDLFFKEMTQVEIRCVMLPPRIIGSGINVK
jgi:ubiquinone/menaquinone biosynthesis C-methylase UbiE